MQYEKLVATKLLIVIQKIYRTGKFTEQQVKFSTIIGKTLAEISHDDQQFLKLMDQETLKLNGHYAVPLLLKPKDVNLQNSRGLALKEDFESGAFL